MPTITIQVQAGGNDVYHHRGTFHHFHADSVLFAAGYAGALEQQASSTARFLNVLLPQGATIYLAVLKIVSRIPASGTVCRTRVFAEAADDAGQIADDAAWHTARNAKTAATVDWTVPPFLADGINTSPDFAAVIQEVVNRPGWVSGNAINIFWDDEDNQSDIGAYRPGRAYEYEGGPGDAPVLEITYGYPVGTATGVEGGFGSSLAVAPGRHGAY